MNQHEIDEVIEAQADLQVAIGFFRLRENYRLEGHAVEEGTWIEQRMERALERLHDLLAENRKYMGRHMQKYMLEHGVSHKSLGLSEEDAEEIRATVNTVPKPECKPDCAWCNAESNAWGRPVKCGLHEHTGPENGSPEEESPIEGFTVVPPRQPLERRPVCPACGKYLDKHGPVCEYEHA